MTKLTAIHIIFALFFIGCKKEIPIDPIRHEVRSSRGYVIINDVQYFTPAIFYWKPKQSFKISTLGSWTGDDVRVTIYKDGILVEDKQAKGQVVFTYNVKP